MVERGNLAGGQASRSVRCLLCAGETRLHDQLPHIWHQREGSGSYDIRWCDACELGFLDPRPNVNDLARFAADAHELRRNWPELIPRRASLGERIRVRIAWQVSHGGVHSTINLARVEEFSGPRPASICILGVRGSLPRELVRAGHKVVAIEPDERDRAELESQGATVYSGSIDSPPAEVTPGTFDIVIASGRLERCFDPRLGFETASRLLKPGGCFMVEVPNNHAKSARRLGQAWYHGNAGIILNFFTGKSLNRLAEMSGLQLVHRLYTNYVTQFRNSRMVIEQCSGTICIRIPTRRG